MHSNIQKNKIFWIIRHLGQETTGALPGRPAGQTPHVLEAQFRELKHSALQERIERRNGVPFTVWCTSRQIFVLFVYFVLYWIET